MRLLTKAAVSFAKMLSPVGNYRGMWSSTIRESYSGAWQQNVEITVDDASMFSPVFACISLISSDISKLSVELQQENQHGIFRRVKNPSYSPVLRRPNHYQTWQQFAETWLLSKLTRGNTYVLLKRGNDRKVRAMYILDPTNVQPLVGSEGDVYYKLSNDKIAGLRDNVTVPGSEIIHDRFNTIYHPLCGLSPIFAALDSIGKGISIDKQSFEFFSKGATAPGIITVPGAISPENAQEIRDHWKDNYTGRNAGNVAVLGDGMKFERQGMTAVDAALVDQFKLTAVQVCSVFHVPPYKIGFGEAPSKQDGGMLNQEYYTSCLQALITAMELGLSEGLGLEGSAYRIKINEKDLLRMDRKSLIEALAVATKSGLMKPDEARFDIDLDPVSGGDAVYMQEQNYSLAALAKRDAKEDPFAKGETAKPEAKPVVEEDDGEDADAQDMEKALAVFSAAMKE